MELPANTSPTSPTKLEHLGTEQTLGKAKYLGCPRFEAPNAITTAVSSGPTKIPGKTAISKVSQTTTIAATILKGPTTALTATTPEGTTTI
ncbi:MAG: hypothetical protein ABSA71_13385 [Desulfomonilia bacterium]|jgi:hypothetical protein